MANFKFEFLAKVGNDQGNFPGREIKCDFEKRFFTYFLYDLAFSANFLVLKVKS